MAYASLRDCLLDLEKNKHLIRIHTSVNPDLEMAEIHRRMFDQQAPALWFQNVQNSPFTAVSNIYGTIERTQFLFRHTLPRIKKIIELKADPSNFFKRPLHYWNAPFIALKGLPTKAWFGKHTLYGQTTIDKLPQIKSWTMDGGAFITLPQVFTLPPNNKNMMQSNLGMYRIQLSGNQYKTNEEIGLHYQLHRGIGVHHSLYNQSDEPFRVSIFVGGPPSHTFAAIMPLPEGLSELTFAGLLNDRRFRYFEQNGHILSADADFCIVGTVYKDKKLPEGPFGDHLGYYSLTHDFPVVKVENVYHRKDAIWQFTVVGRPPQEDSSFGWLIHELVKDLTAGEFPGLKDIHAVDAAGVHPLLLAIGKERYMPFRERKPEEILTIANRILGSGQTSLAKYCLIAADGDDANLDTHDIPHFFNHLLERVDWTRDLHFQTKTTIDTLDYSGSGWNEGSKLIMACCGDKKRELSATLPENFSLPNGFSKPVFVQKGILAIQCPKFVDYASAQTEITNLANHLQNFDLQEVPMIILVDDSEFTAQNLNNFVWVTFTRSNPAKDIYGIHSFVEYKHWGCRGSLLIDARIKTHHAPVLEVDKATKTRVDTLFAKGGELEKWG